MNTPRTEPASDSRRPTIVDVARAAGVSVASASKVTRGAYGVSEQMRSKVMAAVAELQYRPHRLAQAMRGPIKTVGVLLPDIDNPFFALLLRGAADVLEALGYEVFLSWVGETESHHFAAMEALIDHQMDGLLLFAPRGASERLEQIARQVPVVVVGRHEQAGGFDTVSGDDRLGARLVVDHLVEQGHTHIAFIGQSSDDAGSPESVRLDGYREAMDAHGLGHKVDVLMSGWTVEGGRAAARELLNRSELPTAVHAGADITALSLLSELWHADVPVPERIAVVGYDDSPTAALPPVSLTSVDQAGREMGRTAARFLLERIAGRREARHELLKPSLIVRRTSEG